MNKKIKVNDITSNINGTSLVGYVDATYEELAAVLGEAEGDFDKSTAHWSVEDEHGTVATIYDWKTYMTPVGVYSWHIGGHSLMALELVSKLLNKPTIDADIARWNPWGGGNDQ
jgi:hypothetical protein